MNCIYFGGPLLRANKRERLQALLNAIRENNNNNTSPKSSKKTKTNDNNDNDNNQFDIIFLQELFTIRWLGIFTFGSKLRDWFIDEARKLGYNYAVIPGRSGIFATGQDSGTVILSRYPLYNHDGLSFRFWTQGTKGMVHAKVEIKKKNGKGSDREFLNLFSMHLDAFRKTERKAQLEKLHAWKLENLLANEEHVLLGGDMNMEASELNPLTAQGQPLAQMRHWGQMADVGDSSLTSGPRYISGVHNGIDFLMISKKLRMSELRVYAFPCVKSGNMLVSDHPGISVDIEIE